MIRIMEKKEQEREVEESIIRLEFEKKVMARAKRTYEDTVCELEKKKKEAEEHYEKQKNNCITEYIEAEKSGHDQNKKESYDRYVEIAKSEREDIQKQQKEIEKVNKEIKLLEINIERNEARIKGNEARIRLVIMERRP